MVKMLHEIAKQESHIYLLEVILILGFQFQKSLTYTYLVGVLRCFKLQQDVDCTEGSSGRSHCNVIGWFQIKIHSQQHHLTISELFETRRSQIGCFAGTTQRFFHYQTKSDKFKWSPKLSGLFSIWDLEMQFVPLWVYFYSPFFVIS